MKSTKLVFWPMRAPWVVVALAAQCVCGDEFRVEPASVPQPFVRALDGASVARSVDVQIEASGVEPIGDGRFLLVAHDKVNGFFVIETATGRIVGSPLTNEKLPTQMSAGPKWEGLARDEQKYYYAVGSHSGKPEERTQRSHLCRFRLSGGVSSEPLAIDPTSVRRWNMEKGLVAALRREVKSAAEVERMKVEGLAVRGVCDDMGHPTRLELVIGLREPDDLVRVFAADITNDPPDKSELTYRRLFAFEAGLRESSPAQLTSLHYSAAWKGFLILTASEDERNVFHGNTLWFLPDDQIRADTLVRPKRIWDFEVAMKAEGLCELPDPERASDPNTIRLLITYDNDAKSTHIPSRFQVLTVTRR